MRNYSHNLAKLALHFNELPTEVDPEQINDYLYLVKQQHNTPSDSYFKFTVYALRFAYRMEGLKDKRIELPSIKRDKRLPVVLSQEEVRRLLKAPKLLKHRVLIGLLYGCGLRCFEVRNLKISDLDFDRRMLHVRQEDRASRNCPVDSFSKGPGCGEAKKTAMYHFRLFLSGDSKPTSLPNSPPYGFSTAGNKRSMGVREVTLTAGTPRGVSSGP